MASVLTSRGGSDAKLDRCPRIRVVAALTVVMVAIAFLMVVKPRF